MVVRPATEPALLRLFALLLLGVALPVGCDSPAEVSADRLILVSGNNQAGLPGEILPEPLAIRVLGPRSWDFLGRRGARPPARGVEVTFEVEDLEFPQDDRDVTGEEGSRPVTLPPFPVPFAGNLPDGGATGRVTVKTGDDGIARVGVRLGTQNGDWRIEAYTRHPQTGKLLKEHFRLVTGVRKIDEVTEGVVGERIPLRLELREWIEGENGEGVLRPLAGRRVYFRIVGEPYGTVERAEISNKKDTTDQNGVRRDTDVTLGDRPGAYYVLAEVEPRQVGLDGGGDGAASASDAPIRGILYRIVALDWVTTIALLAGGVLLFLLGVRFLSNGFLLILSPFLHFESGPWTENRGLGYLGGTLIGATFLSWSSIASHLVSFVNGGLLNARGGFMLLAGAALGATVLPQVLSLQLGFLAIPCIAAGWLLLILPRRQGLEAWGWVFLGAGLVFASWSLLSQGAEILSSSDKLERDLRVIDVEYSSGIFEYSGRWFLVSAIGLAAGFVLRTSNLLVVVAMVLASHGVLRVESGVALIVGANLGSALLLFARSGLKNQEARRLGALGFLVHLIAALVVAALSLIPWRGSSLWLWTIEWLTPSELFHPIPEDVTQHVALAHTLYNLVGGGLALLFPKMFFAAIDRVLPSRAISDSVKPHRLDDRLIPVPSLALRQVAREVVYATELCQKAVAESFDAFRYGDLGLADQVVRREETVASLQRESARYLALVAENPLSRSDARTLQILQAAAGVLPRIGECAERLYDLTARRLEENVGGSEETDRELGEVYDLVMAQFDNVVTLLGKRDHRRQENVMKTVERLAKSRSRLETQWRSRVEKSTGGETSAVAVQLQALIFQEAFDLLFRVASHLSQIPQTMRTFA